MRFWLQIIIVVASLLLGSAVFAETSLFSYKPAVTALQDAGIIDRGSLDSLRLNESINRAEALKVILKSQSNTASSVASVASNMPPISLFSDVDQHAWYAPYIEIGFRTRLITGYPDGRFLPSRGVRVDEAATMLSRSFGVTNVSGTVRDSGFAPEHFMTRGEFFDMVYKMRLTHGLSSGVLPTSLQQGTPPGQQSFVQGTLPSQGDVQPVQDGAALLYASTKPFAISIPSLGIKDLTVTHPDDPFTAKGVLVPLQQGVGHLLSYPGEGSKVLIYGHSSGYPWDLSSFTKIFRQINKVSVGARVYVTYNDKLLVYQVSEKKTVPASDSSLFEEEVDASEQLYLYTCWPPDSISYRYIVIATLVETISMK